MVARKDFAQVATPLSTEPITRLSIVDSRVKIPSILREIASSPVLKDHLDW